MVESVFQIALGTGENSELKIVQNFLQGVIDETSPFETQRG